MAPIIPGKVQAVRVMMIVGGAVALITALTWAITGIGLLWPGTYYSGVLGFMAIFRGTSLNKPSPKGISIMQIINIVNCDIVNLALGIVQLVLLNDPECDRYFAETARG